MCNLYRLSPKYDLEVYVWRHLAKLWLPEAPEKPFVGPFDHGLFLRPAGDDELEGVVGQCALIRPGTLARKDLIQPKVVPGKKPAAPRLRSTNNAQRDCGHSPNLPRGLDGRASMPHPFRVAPRAQLGDRPQSMVAGSSRRRASVDARRDLERMD